MTERAESITFLDPDRKQHAIDGLVTVPAVHAGLFYDDIFWRVADTWFNAGGDQEPLPYGWIVRLELAPKGDHPPRDFDEGYYS